VKNDQEITCIICPIGCKILVQKKGNNSEVLAGNKCKKGIDYAIYEALDPKRMLTSSVFVENGKWPLVSVKTTAPIPKDKIFEVLDKIKKVKIKAPVKIGEEIIRNVVGLKINVIATKPVEKI
jgi:CxxC motif-containing protein